jgi:hypothetical protein
MDHSEARVSASALIILQTGQHRFRLNLSLHADWKHESKANNYNTSFYEPGQFCHGSNLRTETSPALDLRWKHHHVSINHAYSHLPKPTSPNCNFTVQGNSLWFICQDSICNLMVGDSHSATCLSIMKYGIG